TTVKPSSADGTWTEGSWESRTPPSMKKSTADHSAVFFALSECRCGMIQSVRFYNMREKGHLR
uniref:hypothetical protein n=1 Tax=Paenibacillus macerans TaxID=44252 RepID=UPI001BD14AAF